MDITEFRKSFNKKMGYDALVTGADIPPPTFITTGIPSLDLILGGGWTLNEPHEIYGKFSSGKTQLAYQTVAANQARDPDFTTLWIASETFNPQWAAQCGIDVKRIEVIKKLPNMETTYQTILDALETGYYNLVVLDSYPALIAKAEDEKDMSEYIRGDGARRTAQFFRKFPHVTGKPFVFLFINQIYSNPNGYSPTGVPEFLPGGEAKNYQFWSRVVVRRGEDIKQGTRVVGQKMKFLVVKNKSGPPKDATEVRFFFDDGELPKGSMDTEFDLVTTAMALGIIDVAGSWLSYQGEKWQGASKMAAYIRGDLTMRQELWQAVVEAV